MFSVCECVSLQTFRFGDDAARVVVIGLPSYRHHIEITLVCINNGFQRLKHLRRAGYQARIGFIVNDALRYVGYDFIARG